MYRIALLCFGWFFFADVVGVNADFQLSGKSQKALEGAAMGLMSKSKSEILSEKSRLVRERKPNPSSIPRSTHPEVSDLSLLSEYGYHWCPEWSGGGWCPEGYLCGDGNNGCQYNTCCNDDPNLISCPSAAPMSDEVVTPCGRNNLPEGGGVRDYMCCHLTEICGDGDECTNYCPKGQCCEFNTADVPESCFPYEDEEIVMEEACPDGVTLDCCESHWQFNEKNPAVDMAWADFNVCNIPCLNFQNLDVDVVGQTLTTHCNYCLGMFEYVCHREQGSICSLTFTWDMYLEIYESDEESETYYNHSGIYQIRQIDYECLAEECDTDGNEDAIAELRLSDVLANIDHEVYTNLDHEFSCNKIPHIGHIIPVGWNETEECGELCGNVCSCPTGPEATRPPCDPTPCECPTCQTCETCATCAACDSCCEEPEECPVCQVDDIPPQVYEEEFETSEKVIGTIIIDRSMADFGNDKTTIAKMLLDDFERALNVAHRINILSIVEGSIIATFEVLPPSNDDSLVGSANDIYKEIEKHVQNENWKDDAQLALLSGAKDVGCVSACDPKSEGLNNTTLATVIVVPIVLAIIILAMVIYCCLKNQRREPKPSILEDTDDNRGRDDIAMDSTRREYD